MNFFCSASGAKHWLLSCACCSPHSLENPSLQTFKDNIHKETGLQPERQKIIIKGSILKDDVDFSKLSLHEGMCVLLMGSVQRNSFKNPSTPFHLNFHNTAWCIWHCGLLAGAKPLQKIAPFVWVLCRRCRFPVGREPVDFVLLCCYLYSNDAELFVLDIC